MDLVITPTEFAQSCSLDAIVTNSNILAEFRKGTHGLKQAGKISFEDLKQYLKSHGCSPENHMPSLQKYLNSGLTFTLIVDKFGIKHTNIT